jgi:hypothetical protein
MSKSEWKELKIAGQPFESKTTFQGQIILNKAPPSAILMRHSRYQLKSRDGELVDIYTGPEHILDDYVGKDVEIQGDLREFDVEGRHLKEIWPTRIRCCE